LEASAAIGNACGAIVVSRHGCAPAMPTQAELAHWFSGHRCPRPDRDETLSHLHRVTAPRPRWEALHVLAFDHRSQFYQLARDAGAAETRIPALKALIVQAVERVAQDPKQQGRIGVLIDDVYGEDALHRATGRGWWVGRPIELPGSRPLRFDAGRSLGSHLLHWPQEQVVKCLVHYHPDDDSALRVEQEQALLHVWEATRASGHELLLEVISPARAGVQIRPEDTVLRTIKRLYNLGIKPEWWKLGVMRASAWEALGALVAERDPYCRGAVILGLNQPEGELLAGFAQARAEVVKGFMIGRTVWAAPSLRWLRGEIGDAVLVAQVADGFRRLIDGWRATRQPPARPVSLDAHRYPSHPDATLNQEVGT
ncbi:DUF2090 domain-containing protein, partial [Ralstonia solanacearum]